MKEKVAVPAIQTPFTLMRRLNDEIERLFEDFDFRRPFAAITTTRAFDWLPAIEVFQKEQELFVRLELPGLTKKDVKIEITPEYLTIEGERKQEKEEKGEGFLRTERSYGTFFRSIALPDGVKTDAAKATFKDGILEIDIPLMVAKPTGSRTLPIEEPVESEKEKKQLVGV